MSPSAKSPVAPRQSEDETRGEGLEPRIAPAQWGLAGALLFILLAVFAFSFCDRGRYEDDGLSFLFGAVNLPLGKSGEIKLYKYYHQPLSYEFVHAACAAGVRIGLLYYLAPAAGALGLAILLSGAATLAQGRADRALVAASVLFLPELLYTTLYTNTTAYGLPFFAGAILAATHGGRREGRNGLLMTAAGGALLGTAILFRFDYALGGPLLVALAAVAGNTRGAAAFAMASGAVLALGWIAGLFDPAQILALNETQTRQIEEQFKWAARDSAGALYSILPLPAWLLMGVYAGAWIVLCLKGGKWANLLLILAAAPLLYPVRFLTSPKYLVPAICFIPFAVAWMLEKSKERGWTWLHRAHGAVLLACAVLPQLISFEPPGVFERARITANPARIQTHDRARTGGAYARAWRWVREAERNPTRRTKSGLARVIADRQSGGTENRHAVLTGGALLTMTHAILPLFMQERGYRIESASPRELVLVGPANRLRITHARPKDCERYDDESIDGGERIIKLPEIKPPFDVRVFDHAAIKFMIAEERARHDLLPPRIELERLKVSPDGSVSIKGAILAPQLIQAAVLQLGDRPVHFGQFGGRTNKWQELAAQYQLDPAIFEFGGRIPLEQTGGSIEDPVRIAFHGHGKRLLVYDTRENRFIDSSGPDNR